jgi:sortase A
MKLFLRLIEVALWGIAVAALATCAYSYSYAALHQAHEKELFNALRTRDAAEASYFGAAATAGAPDPGKLLGILTIPRIGLSAVVDRGDDSSTLRLSVGHVPGTALPGRPGNVVLAAHRDTFFRHLYKLRRGDRLTFRMLSGEYNYTVEATHVVAPTDVAVMNPTPGPTLTLITCFPFYYIGSAPKRFVVVATQTSPARPHLRQTDLRIPAKASP